MKLIFIERGAIRVPGRAKAVPPLTPFEIESSWYARHHATFRHRLLPLEEYELNVRERWARGTLDTLLIKRGMTSLLARSLGDDEVRALLLNHELTAAQLDAAAMETGDIDLPPEDEPEGITAQLKRALDADEYHNVLSLVKQHGRKTVRNKEALYAMAREILAEVAE